MQLCRTSCSSVGSTHPRSCVVGDMRRCQWRLRCSPRVREVLDAPCCSPITRAPLVVTKRSGLSAWATTPTCCSGKRSFYFGQRLLARGLELIARCPLRHLIRLVDEIPREKAELRVLDHPVEAPLVAQLIARLVIARAFPRFDLLLAPAGRAVHELRAALEVQRGHADARE